jgi:hypothetical protein
MSQRFNDLITQWLNHSMAQSLNGSITQWLNQRFRLLQILRVEPFSEHAVDLCQHMSGFVLLALLLPQTSQAHRCPQIRTNPLPQPSQNVASSRFSRPQLSQRITLLYSRGARSARQTRIRSSGAGNHKVCPANTACRRRRTLRSCASRGRRKSTCRFSIRQRTMRPRKSGLVSRNCGWSMSPCSPHGERAWTLVKRRG